jgi:hypothetical protein
MQKRYYLHCIGAFFPSFLFASLLLFYPLKNLSKAFYHLINRFLFLTILSDSLIPNYIWRL